MVAGIEETLELWVSSLREVKARIAPFFMQELVSVLAWLSSTGF